jgi:hypothetical protein
MSARQLIVVLIVVTCIAGCAHPDFALTEETAMDRLMRSEHARQLLREVPGRRLMCMVDEVRPGEIDLYLGDDEGTHTTRVDFCRVTADGRLWVNRDRTGLDERWEEIR